MLGHTKLNMFPYCGIVRANNVLVHIVNIHVSSILLKAGSLRHLWDIF